MWNTPYELDKENVFFKPGKYIKEKRYQCVSGASNFPFLCPPALTHAEGWETLCLIALRIDWPLKMTRYQQFRLRKVTISSESCEFYYLHLFASWKVCLLGKASKGASSLKPLGCSLLLRDKEKAVLCIYNSFSQVHPYLIFSAYKNENNTWGH